MNKIRSIFLVLLTLNEIKLSVSKKILLQVRRYLTLLISVIRLWILYSSEHAIQLVLLMIFSFYVISIYYLKFVILFFGHNN